MRLLNLMPANPLPWLIGGAFAVVAAFALMQTLRLADARAALAEEKRGRAVIVTKMQEAAATQTELMRVTERQWQAAQHENARLASKAREEAQAHAAAADAAAGRLRERFTALAATCRAAPGHPAVVAPSTAASAPADMLADVLGRMDEAARRIAAYADAASISGEQCAADYRALKQQRATER